jgi:hypothetical protein
MELGTDVKCAYVICDFSCLVALLYSVEIYSEAPVENLHNCDEFSNKCVIRMNRSGARALRPDFQQQSRPIDSVGVRR